MVVKVYKPKEEISEEVFCELMVYGIKEIGGIPIPGTKRAFEIDNLRTRVNYNQNPQRLTIYSGIEDRIITTRSKLSKITDLEFEELEL
jgi:hypothetical protein